MQVKSEIYLDNLNKVRIFKYLIIHGSTSRIDLSKNLGLSKMSITNYVNELIDDGLVKEIGTVASDSGRKPILLDIVDDKPLFVSVQITRSYICVGIANCKGVFRAVSMAPIDSSETVSSVSSKIETLLDQNLAPEILPNIWAIGASSMGPVDCEDGVLYINEQPMTDAKVHIKKLLEDKYDLPVFVNNDLNALVFAEKYFGNAAEYDDFAIVGSSIGLGSGIMSKGDMFTGFKGLGGEVGHISIVADGIPCYCGNRGCLERYASVPEIIKWVQNAHVDAGIPCEYNNWPDFLRGVQEKNELCLKGFDRLINYLGAGLVTIVNLFNPKCIFLGEYYSEAATLMAQPLYEYIQAHQFFPRRIVTEVKGSRFMGVSPLIGPAAFALHMSLK